MRPRLLALACLAAAVPHVHAQERLVVPPLPPGVEAPTTVTYYDVTGASPSAIWASIVERAPVRDASGAFEHAGYTRWRVDWTYRYTPSPDGCIATDVRVVAPIETLLPRWTPTAAADDVLRAAWDRFDRQLRLHEAGHAAYVSITAVRIHDALRAVRTPTCVAFEATADAVGHAALDGLRAENAAYDRATDHGRIQDAYWSTDDP